MGAFLSEQEQEQERDLLDMLERINTPPVEVPTIAKTYQHNGSRYECYDVHTEATYGNTILTVEAIYRKIVRIEDNGETD